MPRIKAPKLGRPKADTEKKLITLPTWQMRWLESEAKRRGSSSVSKTIESVIDELTT